MLAACVTVSWTAVPAEKTRFVNKLFIEQPGRPAVIGHITTYRALYVAHGFGVVWFAVW